MTIQHAKKVLGIDGELSKEILKKQYRQKAKQIHPDRNKKANAKASFIELKKAHDLLQKHLLNPRPAKVIITVPTEKEVRRQRAYHQRKTRQNKVQKEKREILESYNRFINSKSFVWFKVRAVLGLVLACIYLADNLMPTIKYKLDRSVIQVSQKMKRPSGLYMYQAELDGLHFFVRNKLAKNSSVFIDRSSLFKDVTNIYWGAYEVKSIFIASRSMIALLIMALCFPVVGYIIRGPNIYFLMSVTWSKIAVPFMLVYTMIEQNRFISIF